MDAFQSANCAKTIAAKHVALTDEISRPVCTGGSTGACDDCAEILHGLNNVLAGVLLNAQVMEWKLPSYSRSKRYLHEIERNAQRGGELVKRLLGRLEVACPRALSNSRTCGEASTMAGVERAVATQDPVDVAQAAGLPLESTAHPATVF